jgi:hypothetical protein
MVSFENNFSLKSRVEFEKQLHVLPTFSSVKLSRHTIYVKGAHLRTRSIKQRGLLF